MSSIIDVLLLEAALFILVVTGCFVYGVVSEAVAIAEAKEAERRRRQTESIGRLLTEQQRIKQLAAMQHVMAREDEIHSMNMLINAQMSDNRARACENMMNWMPKTVGSRANVIGSNNNVVNCGCNDNGEWEEERFYSDDTLYLVRKPKVPDAYGTDERK